MFFALYIHVCNTLCIFILVLHIKLAKYYDFFFILFINIHNFIVFVHFMLAIFWELLYDALINIHGYT